MPGKGHHGDRQSMNIIVNSLERLRPPKRRDGFSDCACGKCDQVFFEKATLLKWLQPVLEQYKDLPLEVEFVSAKNLTTGFMTVTVTITQTGEMQAKDLAGTGGAP